MLNRILAAFTAVLVTGAVAFGANLTYQTGPVDVANLRGTINSLIQSINSGVSGILGANVTAASTTATTDEVILQTYTLPGGTLASAGQAVRVKCWGTTAANANNKTMKLYFGSSSITTPTAATNNKGWILDMLVMRRTATTQGIAAKGQVDTTSVTPANTDGAETLSGNIVIKCTGTNGSASASDITAQGMLVEAVR